MNKKILIIALILVLFLSGVTGYFLYGRQTDDSVNQELLSQETKNDIRGDNPLVGSIEKANPFNVDINPIKDYKNPFGQN
jgi:flagellar basal body-associated protein FliL